jgi:hypothetical protein
MLLLEDDDPATCGLMLFVFCDNSVTKQFHINRPKKGKICDGVDLARPWRWSSCGIGGTTSPANER